MGKTLFNGLRRITTAFTVCILCATLSVLTLRLTVFSDMAVALDTAGTTVSGTGEDYQINGKIYFKDAGAKGNLNLVNLYESSLIKADIVLAGTGESILSTGFVNPGSTRSTESLNAVGMQLTEGVYDCVAEITTHDPDDPRAILGSAKQEIQIYITEKPPKNDIT